MKNKKIIALPIIILMILGMIFGIFTNIVNAETLEELLNRLAKEHGWLYTGVGNSQYYGIPRFHVSGEKALDLPAFCIDRLRGVPGFDFNVVNYGYRVRYLSEDAREFSETKLNQFRYIIGYDVPNQVKINYNHWTPEKQIAIWQLMGSTKEKKSTR